MALARTIAGRSLWQRKARTLFSVAGIAMGIGTGVGVFTLDHNTVLGLSLAGLADWRPELEVRPAPGLVDARKHLSETEGVAGVSAFFQNDVSVRKSSRSPDADRERGDRQLARDASGEPEAFGARLFALDAEALSLLDVLSIGAGRTLDPNARVREVLIGEAVATAFGVEPGDTLSLSRPVRGARAECVDGELKVLDQDASAAPERPPESDFVVAGILAREKLGRRSQGAVVVVDYRAGRELFAGAHVEPAFWVRQDPKVDVERLRGSLGTSFSYDLNKSVIVGAAADERAFRNGVRMAGLFALVLGLYVIFHTLSMSLVERVREVATLDALGTSRAQIARIFLCEATAIACLAAVLGVLGGLALARVLLILGITTLGTGHHIHIFDVPWASVLALAALGVGVALLGSIYPLLRARNTNTVAALRGEAQLRASGVARGFHLFAAALLVVLLPALYFVIVPVVGQAQGILVGAVLAAVAVAALLVVLPLVVPSLLGFLCNRLARPLERLSPLAGKLAARAVQESPIRFAVSAAAIALVTSAFVGLKGMVASLRGEVETWAQTALVDKVYLRGLPNVPLGTLRAELDRAYAGAPGVIGIETGSVRTYVPFLLLGVHPTELMRHGPCSEDAALASALEEGRGVILSERLARHLGYAIGDKVHVSAANGAVKDLEVLAISDAYGYFPHPDERLYGVTGTRFMQRAFCIETETLSVAALRLEDGADPMPARKAVAALVPNPRAVQIQTGRALLAEHLADIDRDFRLFDIILGLTALLAALGVLNGQLLSAMERVKELGILKALGVTRRQVAALVLSESAVIGVVGGALGTVLGAALTPVIVQALEALSGLDLPPRDAGAWLFICPVGAVILALAAGLYPIARMNRIDAVAAVRTG